MATGLFHAPLNLLQIVFFTHLILIPALQQRSFPLAPLQCKLHKSKRAKETQVE